MKILSTLSPGNAAVQNRESYYRALMAKDTRFDGVFFTGVKTTGIYCRPVCSVKTPRASSCEFFTSAAAAEAAGFRPCLRCRPELAPYAIQQNLAYAVWQKIAAGELNHRSDTNGLENLSKAVGLSSRQLRRVLFQHFGVSPIELAQTQRLLFAKKLLQETTLSMTDVAYASGFGSVRRFNALFLSRYGLAPSDIRRSAQTSDGMPSDAMTLRLAYRPPYDWPTMLTYLSGRAILGVEVVDTSAQSGSYARSVRIGATEGWLRVTHLPDKQLVQLDIAHTLIPVSMQLISRVRHQFDLDANPAIVEAHLRSDPVLAKKMRTKSGVRVTGAFDFFEIAVRAILGQQISVAGATTLSGRLVQKFGEPIHTSIAGITHHFPQAELLASLPVADIAQIGLPNKRAETIRNLAQFTAQGGFNIKPGAPLDQTISHLKTVQGIGDWTAQYIALRALRFPDAFPAGDLGLQKAMANNDAANTPSSTRLTEKQLALRATAWAPWRGYAAFILWNS
ncbi:MAG TPA: AlkA N-terminal domain-containing protein [Burkholderiaceae bacterium]|jgi:AraC family transcriptional regulator of adaptative response / DNA-3-methyladenine glycosylase II